MQAFGAHVLVNYVGLLSNVGIENASVLFGLLVLGRIIDENFSSLGTVRHSRLGCRFNVRVDLVFYIDKSPGLIRLLSHWNFRLDLPD